MTSMLDLSALHGSGFANLDLSQYIGLWAIEERAAMALTDLVSKMDLVGHVKESLSKEHQGIPQSKVEILTGANRVVLSGYNLDERSVKAAVSSSGKSRVSDLEPQIAVLEIRGAMTKNGSSLSSAGSMVMLRRAMRSIRMNAEIDAVFLVVDSPGGTVTGLSELSQEYAALSAAKPTLTFVEDQMCSACMWVGVQGREVWANADHSTVGSKGVFVGLYDSSEQAATAGIKPVVIRTGDLKGAGFPGEAFTDDQRAMWQTLVNAANSSFDQAMKARKLSDETKAELSRGGVFTAKASVGMGLIDGISSFDDALSRLRSMVPKGKKGMKSMSGDNTASAASLQELKAACPGASNDFLVSQIEQGASIQTAQANWMSALRARNEALEAKQKDADEVSKKLASKESEAADLKSKLDASEKKVESLEKDLKEANKSIASFKKGSGYRPLPSIGRKGKADTGYPGKPVKSPSKTDDVDPDDEDDDEDDDGENASNAIDEWNRQVDTIVKRTCKKRHVAVQALIQKNPELHSRYVEAVNEERSAG